jgi:hypothetical protein
MQQQHGRQPVSSWPRDAQLAGDDDGLGVLPAGQERLIGGTLRLHHMQL